MAIANIYMVLTAKFWLKDNSHDLQEVIKTYTLLVVSEKQLCQQSKKQTLGRNLLLQRLLKPAKGKENTAYLLLNATVAGFTFQFCQSLHKIRICVLIITTEQHVNCL